MSISIVGSLNIPGPQFVPRTSLQQPRDEWKGCERGASPKFGVERNGRFDESFEKIILKGNTSYSGKKGQGREGPLLSRTRIIVSKGPVLARVEHHPRSWQSRRPGLAQARDGTTSPKICTTQSHGIT